MTETAEMDNLQKLRRQHQLFVEEAFKFLLVNSKIESKYLREYRIFRPYIGEAIVTISHIFRKDYRKIFNRLRKNLKHIKMFERYCMVVPVKKDERYFYYILMRMSVIFELSLYSHYEGYDYFKTGKKCMTEYEDLLYFESAGGWGKLAHTALFIASLGRPLTLLMYYNYNESGEIIKTFEDAFSTLYKNFLLTANFEMIDSAEIFCLRELKRVFLTQNPEGKVKCGQDEEIQNENELFENLEVFPKTSFYYCKSASCILIAGYFRKCFQDLISSKALGYVINDFDYENMLDAFDLSTIIDGEEFEAFRDLQNSAHLHADFTGMKVNYIEVYKTFSPVVSPETIGEFLVDEELRADLNISEDSSVLGMSHLDSSLQSLENIQMKTKTPLSLNENPEKYPRVISAATAENLNPNNYNKTNQNIASRKDRNINPTFIVPNKYLCLTNSDDASKNRQLYTAKMWPPSKRRKLSERLKKLLDQNIENRNFTMLPSGDILVRCFESSVNNDTLIILAESCSDDEVDDDTDTLICLFKKIELDSLGKEKGYSLRSRQPRLPKKDRSRTDLEEKTREIMASDEGYPLKIPRTVNSERDASIGEEKLYAKKLINIYKKYFTAFLDKYFNTEFYALIPEQCVKESENNEDFKDSEISEDVKDSEINEDCKYVFAATASLMAKRKVLLDEPDETKRVYGIQLYNIMFQPMVLPLEVQRELDLQIRKGNYFAAPNGVYGVGPKNSVPRENVWVIFFSGNGQQSGIIEYEKEDLKEIPNIFRSYEPVLETFLPLPEDNVKIAVDCIQFLLRDFVNGGFSAL